MKVHRLSIKWKLILITMLTSTMVLLLASVGFVISDLVSFRQTMIDDLRTVAKVIASNCSAALAFNNEQDAQEMLAALSAMREIECAVLYTAEGQKFAEYCRRDLSTHSPETLRPTDLGYRFQNQKLEVIYVSMFNGEKAGTLFLQSDMRRWYERLHRFAGNVGIFIWGAALLAFFLCSRLQRMVSEPILRLASTMERVSAEGNYSLRGVKTSEDEVGTLIDGFNTMLAEIQDRDAALLRAKDELEQRVQARTQELEQEIAARQKTEEEMHIAKEMAEDANRVKSQFLANMSHELRTPMNAIIGYSEMLMEEVADIGAEQLLPDLQKINAAALHQLSLINDILDLSKVEAGRMDLHLETFDIATMIRDGMNTIQPLAERNGNILEVQCPADIGTMHADLTKVRQSLFNLMSNACKFTEGGIISVQVDRISGEEGDWITFRVRDTGIGISPEQMEKLFQPFTQVDTSTTRQYGGTGLGLAITFHFCQMMRGQITVESELGRGSTFTIRFPAEVQAPAEMSMADEKTGGEGEMAGTERLLGLGERYSSSTRTPRPGV